MFGLREKWRESRHGAIGDDRVGLWMLELHQQLEGSGKIVVIGLLSAGVLASGYIGYEAMLPHHTQAAVVAKAPRITPNGSGSGSGSHTNGSSPKASVAPKHHTSAPKRKTAPKSSTPKVQTVGKPVHGVPDFWVKPTGNIFRDIAALNTRYIVWGNHQIAKAVPGIKATGPLAGMLTPQVMNSSAILKKWPGPKVPISLKAAGVKLPAHTPKNGAITGLSLPLMKTVLAHNAWLVKAGVSSQMLMGAYITAGRYVMAEGGNSPMSFLPLLDPYTVPGTNDRFQLLHNSAASGLTEAASQGGVLPLRQYTYESYVSYHLLQHGGFYQMGPYPSAPKYPATAHVVLNAVALNVTDNIIETTMVNGKLVIGNAPMTAQYVYLVLVRQGGQERWYATGLQNLTGGNVPAQTFWKAP